MKTLITLCLLLCCITVCAQSKKDYNKWSFKTTISEYIDGNKLDTVTISAEGSGNGTFVIDPLKKRVDLIKVDEITTMKENGAISFSVKDLGSIITVTTATGAKVSIINNNKTNTVYGVKGVNIKVESRDKESQIAIGKDSIFTVSYNASLSTLVKSNGKQYTFTQGEHTSTIRYEGGIRGFIINIGNVSPVVNPDGSHSVWVFNGNMATIVNSDGTYAVIIK